jgi:hypothetical protein
MIGIGPPVPDLLKDHLSSLVEDVLRWRATRPSGGGPRPRGPGPPARPPLLPPPQHLSPGRNYTALKPVRDLDGDSFRGGLTRYGGEFS